MIDFDTQPTDKDVPAFIAGIDHVRRQHDSNTLMSIMTEISGEPAVLWGDNIIGFGQFKYTHKTGRSVFWPILSFSAEKGHLNVYVLAGCDAYEPYLKKLGKYKNSLNCLFINSLTDIKIDPLKILLAKMFQDKQDEQA